MRHLSSDMLNLYLDGALSPVAQAEAEAHLASCPQCRQELAALGELFAALEAMPAEPLLIDLAPLVLAQLAPAPTAPWPARAWLLLGGQLALALALCNWLLPALAERVGGWLALRGLFELSSLQSWLSERWAIVEAGLWAGWQALGQLEPLAALGPEQWPIALAVAALFWLAANRLFLAGLREPGELTREVR